MQSLLGQSALTVSDWTLALGMAGAIAVTAWRARSLTGWGAAAATMVGTAAMLAGWRWGAFLLLWFMVAAAASRAGKRRKAVHLGDIVAKNDRRDSLQVWANGGVFALLAGVAAFMPGWSEWAAVAGAGALVAAGADTVATETGTLWTGQPWSLRTGSVVPPGTSGAISVWGTLGMVGAALALGASAVALALVPRSALLPLVLAGGMGAFADTAIGAWWQARRWCPTCSRETEQIVHRCGTPTVHHGGLAWLDNDWVNVLCTVSGATLAVLLWRLVL